MDTYILIKKLEGLIAQTSKGDQHNQSEVWTHAN